MADTPRTVTAKALWAENPIFRQVLGICSTLAVTNLLANTLFMCFGVIFVTSLSNLTISLLREYIPKRVRMIVQVLIIASYVMMVDIIIKALNPDIHRFIGPYVGLIITNCIIMGRAEAFASQNKPWISLLDGFASGLGYSFILIAIALVREPLGFGTLLGYTLPAKDLWWHQWTIMVMPPGAFFMLAIVTWACRGLQVSKEKTT
ncbi:MAG: electron transport complex subunit RsxE [Chitinivibrionales bacterium]|nr:electron transport complex subunit RsxE [Chitinivibrionales bacterium]MBD3396229.1 electron transport complex subunit RsxE [Chitinivibrionales bacterium]